MTKSSLGSLSVLMASVLSVSAQAKLCQQEYQETDAQWEPETTLSIEMSEIISEE